MFIDTVSTKEIKFTPHKRQLDLISLPDTVFEALYGGAAGGGKTEILLMLPILREFYKHPKFKGLMLRRTYPELEREVIRRSQYWFPLTGGKYDAEKKSWRWPSGAFFDFGHIEHESDVKKYDTAEYNYMTFDELTSFTEYQYLYLVASRCRSSSPNLPAIVRSGTNPDGIGHNWNKRRFIDPCKDGYTIIKDKLSGSKRIFIPARASDNPSLLNNDADYINRLNLLPEKERRSKLYGDWDILAGMAFDEFRRIHLSDEPINAIHIVKSIDIPKYIPRIAAMDWGWSAATVLLKFAIMPDDVIYVIDAYCRKRQYISTMGPDIAEFCNDCQYLFLDPSAWKNNPASTLTIAEQIERYSGVVPYKADNDRISGKALIHEYLRFIPIQHERKDSSNFDLDFSKKILQIGGIGAYKKYLSQFEDIKTEDNLPKLRIFDIPSLQPLIDMFGQCVINDDNPEDILEFNGDDWYDTLRYGLKGIVYSSQLKPDKKEELTDKFNKGEIEINSYYRMMEKLEKGDSSAKNSVRRNIYHR